MRLKVASRDLSIVDANGGRLVTYQEDVLGIKRRIEETWPELCVVFDLVDEEWVIYEQCLDGVDRLLFKTRVLDQRAMDRIARADMNSQDPLKDIDDYNDALEREQDRRFEDAIGDAGERLAHALWKDGVGGKLSVFFPNRDPV